MEELLKNNLGLEVLTDNGWSKFDGLVKKGKKQTLIIKTENNEIVCTPDHKFYDNNFEKIEANKLNVGFSIKTKNGHEKVTFIEKLNFNLVYDLLNVEKNNRFYANDILVSNCRFLVFDETLINSISLSNLEGSDPIMRMGQSRWYKKINPHSTYVFSLDPSLGTGGDYAAIQVLEIPTMEQVAEWHHNTTPVQTQARVLRDMIKYVDDQCNQAGVTSSIYYSVENNSVGESALMAITELGEESFPGLFLSEPIKKGHIRRFRKGFNTTHSSKIAACSKLKHLLESKQLKINSKSLISELKNFVAAGITFKAKSGQHDDLVSSLLLSIRMIVMLQDWDPLIYEKMRDHSGLEEYDLPMPIYISSF